MTTPRPFRFGVLAGGRDTRQEWLALARRAEALGYATLLVSDHLHTPMAPLAALTSAAEATTTLRVGCHVFANDLRNPVMLAREAATIDLLSGGRLELGLGTGYWAPDYARTGIAFDPPGVRVSRFAEAVQVLSGALAAAGGAAAEPFAFAGAHYTVRDLTLRPRPVQRPRPPLVIGGAGRRVLALAARHADIVGFVMRSTPAGGFDLSTVSPAAFDRAVAWVRETAGARFGALELSVFVPVAEVTDTAPAAAAARLESLSILDGLPREELLETPMALIGSVDHICDVLRQRRERFGFSYPVIFATAMERFAPVVARLAGT
jgi:probable F420-dependent oxidoreductase